MDAYHERHGHDAASFDLPSTHRLPTVSAAEALEAFQGNDTIFVPTGLRALDAALGLDLDETDHGGIQKGQVTEVWGPPGAGKTSFGIQLAANCLKEGQSVVWVDGFHPLPSERLRAVVASVSENDDRAAAECLRLFTHYTCPSVPHFIALLCRPTPTCVPPSTALVVIDSLSALINHEFPKAPDGRGAGDPKGSKGPPLTVRRVQMLQYIVGALQKLAATQDLAIVVLTQCATKLQAERGATLIPAVNATAWDQGISTRLVLFRDWAPDGSESRSAHFVGVQKKNGKGQGGSLDDVTAFSIKQGGLVSLDCDSTQASRTLSPTPAFKRKLADTDFEIADSEDEDIGYLDEEALLPPMPSQWKGSEDILLDPSQCGERDHHEDEESVDELLEGEDGDPTIVPTVGEFSWLQDDP